MNSEIQPTKETKTNGSWRIPIEAIIDLKNQKYSNKQIADLLQCNPANITRRLKHIEIIPIYQKNRADILAYHQARIIQSITDADLKKANLRDKVISAGILYDKERLETGKSTQILGYADAIKARDGVRITLEEIRRVRIERTMQKVSALDSQGFAGGGKNEALSIDIQPQEIIQDSSL